MAYGVTHTALMPTVGSTVGPTFATQINAAIEELRTTLNAKVTPAGMDINADLSLRSGATRYGLVDAHRLTLFQQAALLNAATYPVSVYSDAAGNLYYNNASGSQIQVTSGAGLAGTPGSITSLASPASVVWNSGAARFDFWNNEAGGDRADLGIDGLRLYDADTNSVRLVAPALAADYTLTLPTAVPASTSLLTMSNTGALASTRDPSITSLTTSGLLSVGTDATIGGTLAVTGASTLTGLLTLASNQNILLQGTGYVRHGSYTMVIAGAAFLPTSGGVAETRSASAGGEITTVGSLIYVFQGFPVSTTIENIDIEVEHSDASPVTYTSNTRTTGANNVEQTVVDTTSGVHTVTLGTDFVMSAGKMAYIKASNGGLTLTIRRLIITYKRV